MPVAFCEHCKEKYNPSVAALKKPGFFALCGMCRRSPPAKYLCAGVSCKGDPCTKSVIFNSTRCEHHQEDSK